MLSPRRRTKIVATLGPATDPDGVLDLLIAAGMDCARLNCSHGEHEDLLRRAREVRAASARAGRPVAVLFDLQGPKIRLSAGTPQRAFAVGERTRFVPQGAPVRDGDIEVAYEDFAALVTTESSVVIGDGTPRFAVSAVTATAVDVIASSPGTLGPRKGVNVTHANPLLPALTDKDRADILTGAQAGADFFALSFVRHADDVRELRGLLAAAGSDARVIAKIEKQEAFENLTSIVTESDGVMVARGDYGVEVGLAHVPAMQKQTIARALADGKLVITATQMLESMLTSSEPTRAEALDVHNAVLDGTSALMLSGETGVGAFPVQAVAMMAELATVAERSDGPWAACDMVGQHADEAVMRAAVQLGRDAGAAALVVPTTSGGTARACAKHRPRRPVLALCHDERVAAQLALEWGVHPSSIAQTSSTDELIAAAMRAASQAGDVRSGDLVVITAGPSVGHAGGTNLIALKQVP